MFQYYTFNITHLILYLFFVYTHTKRNGTVYKLDILMKLNMHVNYHIYIYIYSQLCVHIELQLERYKTRMKNNDSEN